jgi:uncharacterized membrane protein
MKLLFNLSVVVTLLTLGNPAFAKCDGIPLKPDERECFLQTDRKSCEYVQGCTWTSEAASIQLCNRTSQKLSIGVKFVRTAYNIIGEEGWYNLESGQCNNFEAPNATSFSYFAKSFSGSTYWFGNGEPMCYDESGNRYSHTRAISDSCNPFTEIQAYQTIPVKVDDFIKAKIEGPGQDLSPVGKFKPRALAWAPASGNYSVRKGATLEEAKTNALHACQSDGEACELAIWLGDDRPACMAILSGAGTFRSWAWSYEGKEVALNQAMDYCRKNGQTCSVDFVLCNDD